jgi:hypothetical protein
VQMPTVPFGSPAPDRAEEEAEAEAEAEAGAGADAHDAESEAAEPEPEGGHAALADILVDNHLVADIDGPQ